MMIALPLMCPIPLLLVVRGGARKYIVPAVAPIERLFLFR